MYALRDAGERAAGATAYVTLEPCSHYGRTPPCADALIKAGVSRVVCAMVDPNPDVAGRGIERIRQAGIEVDVGLLQQTAERLNAPFIKLMTTGMPYVQLKLASTLDGRTALANGESKWITGPDARSDVQRFRAQASAVLSTSRTVLDDDPSLNVRWEQLPEPDRQVYDKEKVRQPIRVILDRSNKVTPQAQLFSLPGEIILVNQTQSTTLTGDNVQQIQSSASETGFDLLQLMRSLAKKGINHIWVEAGATLAGALLEANLVDELIVYQAPKLIGEDGRPLLAMRGLTSMADIPEFDLDDVTRIGNDIRLILRQRKH